MATATETAGNPRLIKQFLCPVGANGWRQEPEVPVDEAALAKLLLFSRLAPPEPYRELAMSVDSRVDGKPHLLDGWEPQQIGAAPAAKVTDSSDDEASDESAQPFEPQDTGDTDAESSSAPIPDRLATGSPRRGSRCRRSNPAAR